MECLIGGRQTVSIVIKTFLAEYIALTEGVTADVDGIVRSAVRILTRDAYGLMKCGCNLLCLGEVIVSNTGASNHIMVKYSS